MLGGKTGLVWEVSTTVFLLLFTLCPKLHTYVCRWLSPKIPYPASPPPSRPNRRSPALRRRPAVIQPTSSGERRVPSPPLSETGVAPDHPYQRTAVLCPPPKGCPQVAAYAALPSHDNLQCDIRPHTSLPHPPILSQIISVGLLRPLRGVPQQAPPLSRRGEGESGDGGTGDTASAGTCTMCALAGSASS